jgi:hypothetical protein
MGAMSRNVGGRERPALPAPAAEIPAFFFFGKKYKVMDAKEP